MLNRKLPIAACIGSFRITWPPWLVWSCALKPCPTSQLHKSLKGPGGTNVKRLNTSFCSKIPPLPAHLTMARYINFALLLAPGISVSSIPGVNRHPPLLALCYFKTGNYAMPGGTSLPSGLCWLTGCHNYEAGTSADTAITTAACNQHNAPCPDRAGARSGGACRVASCTKSRKQVEARFQMPKVRMAAVCIPGTLWGN